ncbi:MAG: DUF5681 domain-containing protein [Rickettsiales bacterium]|jgi:hypothetical protein|nr:DUF5681 domain-containing protein [Rickettsiales bacterium]
MENSEYKVGKNRPPIETRFKPGVCPNPLGRKKGTLSLTTILQKILDQKITLSENGNKVRVSKRQAVTMRLVAEALAGKPRAIALLLPIINTADEKREAQEAVTKSMSKTDQEIPSRTQGRKQCLRKLRGLMPSNSCTLIL